MQSVSKQLCTGGEEHLPAAVLAAECAFKAVDGSGSISVAVILDAEELLSIGILLEHLRTG